MKRIIHVAPDNPQASIPLMGKVTFLPEEPSTAHSLVRMRGLCVPLFSMLKFLTSFILCSSC